MSPHFSQIAETFIRIPLAMIEGAKCMPTRLKHNRGIGAEAGSNRPDRDFRAGAADGGAATRTFRAHFERLAGFEIIATAE